MAGPDRISPRFRWNRCRFDSTIALNRPDQDGWIVACVLEVPGALSQGRTREEARANVLDALRTFLAPDETLAG